jgi:GWxTD domain-containing protein
MKIASRNIVNVSALFAMLLAAGLAAGADGPTPASLAPAYRQWLEEVRYIMTRCEKDAFLQLQSDRERELFEQAFWLHRDPTPGTKENEFRDEHYRRLRDVEAAYGRARFAEPGWQTDRGKIHIILGPPQAVQHFDTYSTIRPLEVWHYQIEPRAGLPPAFNLIFFDPDNSGNFRLYSPIADGPRKLLTGYQGDPADDAGAYAKLDAIDSFLARTALSLIPGEEGQSGAPSMSSDFLLRNIDDAPRKLAEDRYARKFIEYQGRVDVDYALNYVLSRNLGQLFIKADGRAEFHYLVQLERLSVNQVDDAFTSQLEVTGTLTDRAGRTLYQYTKSYPIRLDERQIEAVRASGLAIADRLPVIPGEHKLSLLIKNSVSKEFTAYETTLSVPAPAGPEFLTGPLLAYAAETSAIAEQRPFTAGPIRFQIDPENRFCRNDRLTVFFQSGGTAAGAQLPWNRATAVIQGEKGFRTSRSVDRSACGADGNSGAIELSLQELPADFYQLTLSLSDAAGHLRLQSERRFTVAPLNTVPRPQVLAKTTTLAPEAADAYVLGTQYLNAAQPERAAPLLEKACHLAPQVREFALALARLCLARSQFARAEALLVGYTNDRQPDPQIESVLGAACLGSGKYSQAGDHFRRLITCQGPTTTALNALAACCMRLNDRAGAQRAWTDSLRLDPSQAAVQRALQETGR